ncbi:alpha/beta hydrolase [Stackebrandtia nassauensis]|uniref:TAP domain protein n=1 Tax=Stackebrandtia nassauensis (strain DSM 44728 / CIP 108903 / NRRL B-16338 / NBRC 102104 / LLR-40K-21) TaxID=446470 RepID=D3Q1D6_STANL|nr:alpha/beta hydrolase [Stackebrandtia nassauensis]ADD45716.1 TAP domain protein [Stackebrandtia nassauensis DSM 44728]
MRKRYVALAAVLAVATAVTVTRTVSADPVADIAWGPCEGVKDDVQCATLEVPVDYANPDGEAITVGLSKRAATDPDKRIGSLLVDGVDMVKDAPVGSKRMQERFDLIGFDPRGTKRSTRIECDKADMAAVTKIGVPNDRKEFKALVKANRSLAEGCRDLTGPLFDHADNLHIVEDIESIRKALGEKKFNFLGFSNGTLMGQQYAEKYPKNLRSMVLDGNMDHSLESTWEYMSSETAAVERNFNSFAKWCDETKDCALYGEGTADVYGELRDAARAGELTDPETGAPIDFYDFSDRAFAVNTPQQWSVLAKDLKTLRAGEDELKLDDQPRELPVEYLMQSKFCGNWDLGVRNFGEWEELTERLAEEYPNTQWSKFAGFQSACFGGAIETTNPQAPLEIDGAPPLVMIGNHNDFATVYEWSKTAAEQSGATLITYEGYGHTVYGGGNKCVDEPVESYFIELKQPDEGISCESTDEPGRTS